MSNVSDEPPMGQDPAITSLCWSNPEAAKRWLSGVKSALDDALAASGDQMLPLRQRRLGHVEAERILREATVALHNALSFAERGLPPLPPRG
jgi:hypothetical protein